MRASDESGTEVTGRRVVVVTSDLTSNAAGRALVFVDLLNGYGDVVLAGPSSGRRWPPLAARSDIEIVELPHSPCGAVRVLASRCPGYLAVASKPLLMSYGVALAARERPLVLDIDDPELALATANPRTFLSTWLKATNPLVTAGLIMGRGWASTVTVSNNVLRARYGGTVIPHARNEGIFDERLRDREVSRGNLGLATHDRIVAYIGTTRGHKGINILRAACRRLPRVRLALVGSTGDGSGPNEIHVPWTSYPQAMRWLSAADVVAVPQLDTRVGRAQSPAKLVDALAMGRAIVTTNLPPIVETVGECALVVAPGSVEGMATAILRLLEDDVVRERLEVAGRDRFANQFSFAAVRPSLLRLLDQAG